MKGLTQTILLGISMIPLGIGLLEYKAERDIMAIDPSVTNMMEFTLLFSKHGFYHVYGDRMYHRENGIMIESPYRFKTIDEPGLAGFDITDSEGNVIEAHHYVPEIHLFGR